MYAAVGCQAGVKKFSEELMLSTSISQSNK
jgi:hypothetical protein